MRLKRQRQTFPETHELTELLEVVATGVSKGIDGLLCELDLRTEAVRAGNAAPEPPQSLTRPAESPQISDRVHRLREWLFRRKLTKEEAAEDRAAA